MIEASAGSARFPSLYKPALTRRSRSSAGRPARSRQELAAASDRRSAPDVNGKRPPSEVATASIRAPMRLHQLVHLEEDDADLEARGERQQHHLLARLEPSLAEVAVQRDEVRGRRGVAEVRDVDDDVLGSA